MLPPLKIFALEKSAPVPGEPTDTADSAARGGFETSLAAFLPPAAAGPGPGVRTESLKPAGGALPQGGKLLPLAVLGASRPGVQEPPLLPGVVPGGAPASAGESLDRAPVIPESLLVPGPPVAAVPPGGSAAGITLPGPVATPGRPSLAVLPPRATRPLPGRPGASPVPTVDVAKPPRQVLAGLGIHALPEAASPSRNIPVPGVPAAAPSSAAEAVVPQTATALPVPVVGGPEQAPDTARASMHDSLLQADLPQRGLLQLPSPPVTPAGAAHPAAATAWYSQAPAVPSLNPISLPPGSDAWSDALGDRVVVMAGSRAQSAEIRLHPADLGPLRVQISIDDGTATVNFQAHHALTRDAIEQALPRLREMLGDQGLSLGEANVSEHGVQQEQSAPGRHGGAASVVAAEDTTIGDALDLAARPADPLALPGLVDLFA